MFIKLAILCVIVVVLTLVSYLITLYNCLRKAEVLVGSTLNNNRTVRKYKQAPGPLPWPVLGNMSLLAKHKVPFQAFTELANEYGDIYSLTLGTTRCLIVNSIELIREVLNQNGKFFGGRPDFLRYHKLFGGDRNNSLALCNWSHLQQKRRNLARRHCSPRDSSSYFTKMSDVGCFETDELMSVLQARIVSGKDFDIKPLIQQACANTFCQYMCSVRFDYDDTDFQRIVQYFDEIFWEINQGYAVDFLPWLAPFYKKHVNKIIHWSTTIRKFILERIINEREQLIDLDEPENDFTDALLRHLAEDRNVSRDTIIYMLEDLIGGHSAVGNLVMLTLAYVAKHPEIGENIQNEVDCISNGGKRNINLHDMDAMPYTQATIFEVLRYSSSPIVPHVATEDAVVSGYGITAGTIVFINNYKLNTSSQYWSNPEKFDPERFLENIAQKGLNTDVKRRNSEGSDSGVEVERDALIKNSLKHNDISINKKHTPLNESDGKPKLQLKKNIPHFLPFSIGKRTCIGQNLVRGFSFILVANMLQRYDVSSNDFSTIQINPACVALPPKTFPLVFKQRSSVC